MARVDLRIVLIGTVSLDVVLVVHVLNVLPGVVLGLLTVDKVHSLGLGELVNLSTGEADEELLGELVGDWLSCTFVQYMFKRCIVWIMLTDVPSLRWWSSNIYRAG
jgi:hypothetical protein